MLSTESTVIDQQTTYLHRVSLAHPVFRRITRWEDMVPVHKAVMALFPQELPGKTGERRAHSRILYRIERRPEPNVLVQSSVPFDYWGNDFIKTTTLNNVFDSIDNGMQIAFTTRINAVKKIVHKRIPDPNPLSRLERPDGGFFHEIVENLQVLNLEVNTLRAGKTPLHTALISGTGIVVDSEALKNRMLTGMGSAKSYGCGMLSVIPIG